MVSGEKAELGEDRARADLGLGKVEAPGRNRGLTTIDGSEADR